MYNLKKAVTDFFKGEFQRLSETEWALCRPEIGGDEASFMVATFNEAGQGRPDHVEITIEEFDFINSDAYAEEDSAAHSNYWDGGWVKDWEQTRKKLEINIETWMAKQGWSYWEHSKYPHYIFRELGIMNDRAYEAWDK